MVCLVVATFPGRGPAGVHQRFCLIKRRPYSLKQRKETCTVSMNLHGLGRYGKSIGEHQWRSA